MPSLCCLPCCKAHHSVAGGAAPAGPRGQVESNRVVRAGRRAQICRVLQLQPALVGHLPLWAPAYMQQAAEAAGRRTLDVPQLQRDVEGARLQVCPVLQHSAGAGAGLSGGSDSRRRGQGAAVPLHVQA